MIQRTEVRTRVAAVMVIRAAHLAGFLLWMTKALALERMYTTKPALDDGDNSVPCVVTIHSGKHAANLHDLAAKEVQHLREYAKVGVLFLRKK
jgi:hypothetical protein